MKHAIRLTIVRIVTAVILISLILFIPVQVCAAPGDETSNPQLSLVPAIENISVVFSFNGDNNGNNQAFLYYRQTGTSTWKPGIQMTADRRSNLVIYSQGSITNPYRNQWRAIIFGLNSNTSYDVKIDYTDVDGGSGTTQSTVKTVNANPPSNGNTYYVSKSGSDTSGNGSQSSPWLTIQKAADNVSPGDRVRIMPGTYNEQVVISRSGTVSNYITFESYDYNNMAIVTRNVRGTFNLNGTDYIRIRYLDIRTTAGDGEGVQISGNAVANIIENCKIDIGSGRDWWCAGIWLMGSGNGNSPSYTVIQNNVITTNADGSNGPFGILMWDCDVGGTAIKGNTITGHYQDGIATIPNFGIETVGNFFIYDNVISGANDDCIEVESGGMNVGIWNNILSNSRTIYLAAAPCIIGPLYIFRNEFNGLNYDWGQSTFKLGSSSYGHIYFYHNTIYKTRGAGFATAGSDYIIDNIVVRNNIIEISGGSQYCVEEYGLGTTDFDYNSMWNSSGVNPIKWLNEWYSWQEWRDDFNQETHGIFGPESFVNPAGGDFTLQSASPAIDKGVILTGFNDANSPWPYSGNAPDMGANEYTGAPPADNTPPYTSGHNPQKNSITAAPNTNIVVHIGDSGTGVDQSSIVMRVNSSVVSPTITGTPYDYTVTYNPPIDFNYKQVVNVTINARDLKSTPNVMNQDSYSFTIKSEVVDNSPPYTSGHNPQKYSTTAAPSTNIVVHIRDTGTGVDQSSIQMRVNGSLVSPTITGTPYDYTVTYNPPVDFNYKQVVNVRINASDLNSTPNVMPQETYSFTIRSEDTVNHSPVASNDQYGTNLDTPVIIGAPGVLINDNDSDGDSLSVTLISGVSHGSLTLSPDGSFIFTPEDSYTGLITFSYQAYDGQANSNIAVVTINVASSGGDGSGGGGDDSNLEITSVSNFVSLSGKFNIGITVPSSDNNVKITILKDTVGTNSMGVRLVNIVIEKMVVNIPPPPDGAVIVGSVYDITPDGANFDPAVYLSMSYSDNQVPYGVSEKNLIVSTYDWSTGEWQPIPSSTNLADNAVTANLEHFSTYALLAYTRPACFEIEDISTNPNIVTCGSNIDIRATVVNTGDLTGDYEVCLMLDDEVFATELITLDGGDSTILTFSTITDVAGLHRMSIGVVETTFTAVEYEAPANFITSNINVTPTEIYLGGRVEISTLISNIGDLSGVYEAILKMDNEFVDSKTVNMAGHDSEIIIFTVTPGTEGEHAINIGEKVVFFTVKSTDNVDEEIITMAKPKISRFDITPTYDPGTGKIESTRIDYQIINSENLDAGSMLILKVFREGEIWEEIPLITLNQLETDQNAGHLSYVPSEGWSVGTYIFEAELQEQNGVVHSIQFEKFTLIEESITKAISWGSLGIIIGGTLIVLLTVLAIVIYRRREMLRGYVE